MKLKILFIQMLKYIILFCIRFKSASTVNYFTYVKDSQLIKKKKRIYSCVYIGNRNLHNEELSYL